MNAEQQTNQLKEDLKQCQEVNALLIDTAIEWRTKLATLKGETLKFKDKGAFTSDMRACAWELLGLHVAQDKIPKVIESVMHMAKTKFDKLPAPSTVRVMADEMLCVAQSQLDELLPAENLSLQTDETPKFGQCYEAFIVIPKTRTLICWE